jgi:chromosome partitioning protein
VSGKVIAVANMKGGVGKTATVVALAEALAAEGNSILVIDADAQANASICIVGDKELASLISGKRTIDAFLHHLIIGGQSPKITDCIFYQASDVFHRGNLLDISLLASSSELRLLERNIIFELTKRKFGLKTIVRKFSRVMKDQLGKTKKNYDYVLIDCAPGISALTEASIRLADLVIVPTIPDFLSSYGLASFCKSMWRGDGTGHNAQPRPKMLPRVLFTRKRLVKEHAETIERIQYEQMLNPRHFELFETIIPEATAVSLALRKNGTSPTFTNKWGANLVPVLSQLAEETKEALNGN